MTWAAADAVDRLPAFSLTNRRMGFRHPAPCKPPRYEPFHRSGTARHRGCPGLVQCRAVPNLRADALNSLPVFSLTNRCMGFRHPAPCKPPRYEPFHRSGTARHRGCPGLVRCRAVPDLRADALNSLPVISLTNRCMEFRHPAPRKPPQHEPFHRSGTARHRGCPGPVQCRAVPDLRAEPGDSALAHPSQTMSRRLGMLCASSR